MALKADFLKEIATMKKITMGNCPNIVNMVGCCTLQEPLSLVLEYIPKSDLRTYLWTIRKQVSIHLKLHIVMCTDNYGRGLCLCNYMLFNVDYSAEGQTMPDGPVIFTTIEGLINDCTSVGTSHTHISCELLILHCQEGTYL